MSKTCILLGRKSEIAQRLLPYMVADGWTVHGWARGEVLPPASWDLCMIPIGRVAPVGLWNQVGALDWDNTIVSNVMAPVWMLKSVWSQRNPDSAVCFFAGANPNKPMENYSAYSVGKMALLKACEHLDLESPDVKLFALAPGVHLTKIHQATRDAGVKNERLERADKGEVQSIERVWECIRWCLSQPKSVIGGRNICASDPFGPELAARLATHPNMFKLRRAE